MTKQISTRRETVYQAAELAADAIGAEADEKRPHLRIVTSGTGYDEFWVNMMPLVCGDAVTGQTDLTGFLGALLDDYPEVVALQRFILKACKGVAASDSNDFGVSDFTRPDVHAIADNIGNRHFPGALGEQYVEAVLPGERVAAEAGDETDGIDRRMDFDMTAQVKTSWDAWPTPSPSAIGEARALIAVRLDSETLDGQLRIVHTA
jgi:hypothetical protein